MQIRPLLYNPNFAGRSNTTEIYDYLTNIAGKSASEVKDELLEKIAKAKTEQKTFEIKILEAKARKLGLIK